MLVPTYNHHSDTLAPLADQRKVGDEPESVEPGVGEVIDGVPPIFAAV